MFAHTNLITYESLYSSSYLLNEYLLYDKLWGPSQRVVTLFSLLIFHRALIIIWDDLILIVVNLKPSLVWSRSQSLLRSRCFNGTVKKDLWDLISSYLFSIVQNASLPSTLRNWFIASVLFFFRFSWLWDIILCLVLPWKPWYHD